MQRHGLIALALVAAVGAVYLQVRGHEFVDYDDFIYIVDNPNLPPGPTLEGIVRSFTTLYEANWIPLTWISLQFDYGFYGREPAGYLLTNVALHALSSLLLFLAFSRMTGAVWRSAFVAAVFALHPLHVESVAWASERKDALSGVFWMLALHAYVGYVRHPTLGRYASVALCLSLGLLAKPMLVTLPFVLLLFDYWPLGRLWPGRSLEAARVRRAMVEKLPLLALSAAASFVALAVQRAAGFTAYGDALPLPIRVMNALDSWVVYVGQSVWPRSLSPFYPHPAWDASPWRAAASALGLLAVSLWVARRFRSHPYLPVGWLWYLGTLVPVIGLVQVGMQGRADRYMYLPLVGLSVMVAWGAADVVRRWPRLRPGVAVAGVVALAALGLTAGRQVTHWRDTITLYERAIAANAGSPRAHHRLAAHLSARGIRLDEAATHFAEAARLRPRWADPVVGLADLMAARGEQEAAVAQYQQGLALDPGHARAHGNLGIVLVGRGRFAEARPHLEHALSPGPESAEFHSALGVVATEGGRPREAVRRYRDALERVPGLRSAALNLAWLLATSDDPTLRDGPEAVRLAEAAALRERRPQATTLGTLAAAYAASGRFEEAIRSAREAEALAAGRRRGSQRARILRQLERYRAGELFLASDALTDD